MAMTVRSRIVRIGNSRGIRIRQIRPCLIISTDEMNAHIATVIVAPMTTKGRDYPSRVACQFEGKAGQIVLDQIRTVDKSRLAKKLAAPVPPRRVRSWPF